MKAKRSIALLECLFLAILFLATLAIRWYKLPQNLFFGFEQGRDAAIVRDIIHLHQFKLVGPKTDIGGVFHGAYYYYLLIPAFILSHGNPLALSFTLVLLSSTVPLIFYFFGKYVFHSRVWAGILAILAATSFELITYSRWLSNVTPALPLLLLSFFSLWLYQDKKKQTYFLLATFLAAAAAQFEIILVILFSFTLLVMFVLRAIPFPKLKTLLLAIGCCSVLFIPHLIFNFRNQNILFGSLLAYAKNGDNALHPDIWKNILQFAKSYSIIVRKAFSLSALLPTAALVSCTALGLLYHWKSLRWTKWCRFLIAWAMMPLPILIFRDAAQLTQLYLAVGMVALLIFVTSCRVMTKTVLGRTLIVGFSIFLLFGWASSFMLLDQNLDVFFVTIQEGLNYADQLRTLQFVHQDAAANQLEKYRLLSLTIPYLHPEAWQYLQNYLTPGSTDDGKKVVYVTIEPHIEPFWTAQWIHDLGPTKLVSAKQFGAIIVEKRIITTP